MKLIIDIPKEVVDTETYAEYFGKMGVKLYNTLKNGTPIPDNATNGEVIDLMFGSDFSAKKSWWNAPYQKGGGE